MSRAHRHRHGNDRADLQGLQHDHQEVRGREFIKKEANYCKTYLKAGRVTFVRKCVFVNVVITCDQLMAKSGGVCRVVEWVMMRNDAMQ